MTRVCMPVMGSWLGGVEGVDETASKWYGALCDLWNAVHERRAYLMDTVPVYSELFVIINRILHCDINGVALTNLYNGEKSTTERMEFKAYIVYVRG